MSPAAAIQISPEDLVAHSPAIWAREAGLLLDGKPLDFGAHPYQWDVIDHQAPMQCVRKAAQMGFTSAQILRSIHGMIYRRYQQGVLYLFPTRDDTSDFSKGRFAPLIQDNPIIAAHVRDTDAAGIKRVGSAMLYLRGTRSRSQLKSVPVDRIVFDERDEMSDDMVALAIHRTAHSTRPELIYISTPTIPDWGVDALYQASDQRVWMIRCQACRAETCLELEFPTCISEDGRRLCRKCGRKIHSRDGRWVAQVPKRSRDMVGWWISQLNSPTINPASILAAYADPRTKVREFHNSVLGLAYIEAENRLTEAQVYECCNRDPMATRHAGPCVMGVDVGDMLHAVIGQRVGDASYRIVKLARVSSFNDIHDLGRAFGVEACAIDLRPETRKVRDFQAAESYRVWGVEYSEHQVGRPAWHDDTGMVTAGRTEVMDAVHEVVVTSGALSIPRRCEEIEEYAREMHNTAKALEEDPVSGARMYRYRKLGADHYYHATVYFWLAAQRVSPVSVAGMWGRELKYPAKNGII